MDRSSKFGLALSWTIAFLVGCGGSSTPDTPAPQAQPEQQTPAESGAQAADPRTDPIAKSAFDFLDAVLKGDTQRAGAQLTPAAMQRFIENSTRFAPPGLDQASFRIGEIRKPSETQALVQCFLTANVPSGEQKSEEMCCLMKFVDNSWRVSGIAYAMGPQNSPMILDFENPQQPVVQQTPMASQQTEPTAPVTPGRPSPPRAAQETPGSLYR